MAAESGQSSNRLFIILAVALIGLICIGLMGLGGVLFLVQSNRAQEEAALLPEATATPFPPTFTPTPTSTFTPTNTPEPTSTSTPVIRTPTPGAEEASSDVSAQVVETVETAPGTPVESPTAGQLDGGAADTTPTPAVVPGSGGVLPATSSGTIAGVSGLVLLLLVISGVIFRHRSSI